MKRTSVWIDLQGREYSLAGLDADERKLVARLKRHAASHESADFRNFFMKEIATLHGGRGMSRAETVKSTIWRVAQDIAGRLMIQEGIARAPDYRDDLEQLIRERFKSRRAFCEAAGISEDMLSHVLARRKHLSVTALTDALARVGCRLRIVPEANVAK